MKKWLLIWVLGWASSLPALAQTTVLPYEPGEGLRLQSGGKYSLRLSGMMQPMVEMRTYPANKGGDVYTRFRMRRLIAKLTGEAAPQKLSYQIQIDLTGSSEGGGDASPNNYLMDAWVAWKPVKQFEIVFGQDNTPTDSRELGMLSSTLQFAERSQVSLSLAAIREFGVFVYTNFKVSRNSLLLASFAVTNGDGANVLTKDYGGFKYGGRLDFLPFGSFANAGRFRQVDMERELTPKLVIGGTYSLNNGVSDRRGRESGSILYLDTLGNITLPDFQKVGVDFLFKYQGISISGEYVKSSADVPTNIRQRVRNDGSTSTSFLVNGVQDVDSYIKGRLMLGTGFNIQGGYLLRNGFSFDVRYSKITPARNSFYTNGQFFNRSDYYTVGISKYLDRNYGVKIQAMTTVAKAKSGSLTVKGEPLKGNEVSTIVMITFAL